MTSTSKFGPHIGEGAGNVAALGSPRYAKFLDAGGVQFAPPGTRCIVRGLYDDEGALIALGYAGGVVLARRQLDQAQALGVLARVWAFEGFNECWANDPAWLAFVMQAVRGYADTIHTAGKVAIPFSIQVGNGLTRAQRRALQDTRADAMPATADEWAAHDARTQALLTDLAMDFQYLFAAGAHVAYHAYWGPFGPADEWDSFAGRYQQFAVCLRVAGVTATQRWALTEGGYETLAQYTDPDSGPVWDVVLPEAEKIADYLSAASMFDADPLVSCWIPFTFWHRTDEWSRYDLAVRPNGQPWQVMLDALAGYVAQPGTVNDPPASTPPPPGTGGYATVTAPTGLRVRETPDVAGRVLGLLPFGSRVLVRDVAGTWARLALAAGGATLTAGASDPDPHGYAAAQWLRFE